MDSKIQGEKKDKTKPKKKNQLLKTLEETSQKTLKEKRFQTARTTGSGLRNSFSKTTCAFSDFGYLYVVWVDFSLKQAAMYAALQVSGAKITCTVFIYRYVQL